MEEFRSVLIEIVDEIRPCTVHQLFYQCVSRGLVEKTKRHAAGSRKRQPALGDRRIDWNDLSDGTHGMVKPDSWQSPAEAAKDWALSYRHSGAMQTAFLNSGPRKMRSLASSPA
jgi:hypothetical protein